MKSFDYNRRKFIRNAATNASGLMFLSVLSGEAQAAAKLFHSRPAGEERVYNPANARIKFSVIGANHNHINSMVEAVMRGGGELVSFYVREPDLAAEFKKRFAQAKQVQSEKEILEDKSINLVLSSIIPDERAPLGIKVMEHGKDYLVDKPGITTLEQLADVRRVQKETKRIFSIMNSERLENKATVKAGEMVKAGAIGKVMQTIGMGPHKINASTRPPWFFERNRYGGIITDIGSHQFDQYLFFTNTTKAEIVASQVGNLNHPDHPGLEDFGDVMLRGNGGTGYIRVDWFTPGGLNSWGDGRLTILGTDGYIEIRKNIDIAGRPGGNHLFYVNQKETKYIDCNNEPLPFGKMFVDDILNRTETAMPQEHCFLATELALKAQKQAQDISQKNL
jgi:predicted dehydrogenase